MPHVSTEALPGGSVWATTDSLETDTLTWGGSHCSQVAKAPGFWAMHLFPRLLRKLNLSL